MYIRFICTAMGLILNAGFHDLCAQPILPHAGFETEGWRRSVVTLERERAESPVWVHEFRTDPGWTGKQIFALFNGIHASCRFRINSIDLGPCDPSGYPSGFNLTPFLMEEGKNRLELQFDDPAGMWSPPTSFSAFLVAREPLLVRDLEVITYPDSDRTKALIRVTAVLQNLGKDRNPAGFLSMSIFDPDSRKVHERSGPVPSPLSFRQETRVEWDQYLEGPKRWAPLHPWLYTLSLSIEDRNRNTTETISTRFGICSATVSDSLAIINGDTILLGYSGPGMNAVHSVGYLPDSVFNRYDSTGILVVRKRTEFTGSQVLVDRNHASVVWQQE